MRKLHVHECRRHGLAELMVSRQLGVACIALACASLAPACSGDGRAPHPDASGLFHCTSSADCDDHTPCTLDNCDVSNVCQHNPIDAMCPGQHCVSGVGCTSTTTCTDSTMCDDGVGCTIDTCNVGNVCGHQTVDSLCSAPTPVCNATMDCVAGTPPGCTAAAQCDDTVACTVDSCGVDMMCHHMTVDTLCGASEHCDATMGCVTVHSCTTAADCMDPSFYNFCDGTPICSPEFGCMFPTPRVCDDGNMCTLDACDRTAGTNGACTTACDHSVTGCDTDPACVTAAPTCIGTFAITPELTAGATGGTMCALGMVHYDITQFDFAIAGGIMVVTPGPGTASFGTLTDSMAPVCPSFSATVTVGGGTAEHYTLTGDFTDNDHFTGTFTTLYDGGPANCFSGPRSVTGTRM